MESDLSFNEWLELGEKLGYCSSQYCTTHDLPPTIEEEEEEFSEGGDPCIHAVRLGSPDDWQQNF